MSNSLQPHGLYCPWNSLGQNTRVGSLSLLQGIFPTQESNPGLPHCRQILCQLSPGKPCCCCQVASVVSDSVRPQRWPPTRLPRPWDSPGKHTGVGFHVLLQCRKVKSESEVAQSSDSQRPHGLQPTRLLRPWDFPGKSTGVGCHWLLHFIP